MLDEGAMEELKPFLDANKKEIIDLIEGIQRVVPSGNGVETKLIAELVSRLSMQKYDQFGVTDKAHVELAHAIIEAMWCGWLSQAKANRGVYALDWPDKFEEAILDAIRIGRQYASIRH
jgi:hypothetical protein